MRFLSRARRASLSTGKGSCRLICLPGALPESGLRAAARVLLVSGAVRSRRGPIGGVATVSRALRFFVVLDIGILVLSQSPTEAHLKGTRGDGLVAARRRPHRQRQAELRQVSFARAIRPLAVSAKPPGLRSTSPLVRRLAPIVS